MLVWMLVVMVRHGGALSSAWAWLSAVVVRVVMGELGVLPVFHLDAAIFFRVGKLCTKEPRAASLPCTMTVPFW